MVMQASACIITAQIRIMPLCVPCTPQCTQTFVQDQCASCSAMKCDSKVLQGGTLRRSNWVAALEVCMRNLPWMMTQSHGSSQLERILITSPGTSREDGSTCHLPPLRTSAAVSYFVTYVHNSPPDVEVLCLQPLTL